MVNKVFLTRIGNIHFFANVLEGLFGEYHSSSVALGNVLNSQSQLSRVLVGLFLAYQVVVCRIQCSTSSGLLSTDFNILRKSCRLSSARLIFHVSVVIFYASKIILGRNDSG